MRSLIFLLLLLNAVNIHSAPTSGKATRGLGALLTARTLFLSGDTTDALKVVRTVVRRYPDHLYARNLEAKILFALYNRKKQPQILKKIFLTLYSALEHGKYNRTFFNLARYHIIRGDSRLALGMFRDGLELRFNRKALSEYFKLSQKSGKRSDRIWGLYSIVGSGISDPQLLYSAALQLLRFEAVDLCERLLARCSHQDSNYYIKIKALHARARVLMYLSRYREALKTIDTLGRFYRRGLYVRLSKLTLLPLVGTLPGSALLASVERKYPGGMNREQMAVFTIARKRTSLTISRIRSLPATPATAAALLLAGYRGRFAGGRAGLLLEKIRRSGDVSLLRFWLRKLAAFRIQYSSRVCRTIFHSALEAGLSGIAERFFQGLVKRGLFKKDHLQFRIQLLLHKENLTAVRKLIEDELFSSGAGVFEYRKLALLLLHKRKYQLCNVLLDQWKRRKSGDPTEKMLRINLYGMQGRYGRVIEAMRGMPVDDLPGHYRNLLAYSLAHSGKKLRMARRLSMALLEKRPFHAAYLDTLGWILYSDRKYKSAEKWIRRALAFNGDGVSGKRELMVHLGDVLVRLKRKGEAVEWYKRALSGSTDRERSIIMKKIQSYRSGGGK